MCRTASDQPAHVATRQSVFEAVRLTDIRYRIAISGDCVRWLAPEAPSLAARGMRAIDTYEEHVSISRMEGLSYEGESAAANCRVVLAPGGGGCARRARSPCRISKALHGLAAGRAGVRGAHGPNERVSRARWVVHVSPIGDGASMQLSTAQFRPTTPHFGLKREAEAGVGCVLPIPSFLMRKRSVFGCRPSCSAAFPAPLIRQSHSRSTV